VSYESRSYDDEHGDPVVVLVATGTHDVSRLVANLSRGTCSEYRLGEQIVRQVRRHNVGRAALRLLKQHGGPDFTGTDAVFEAAAAERVAKVLEHTMVMDSSDCPDDEQCRCPGGHPPVPGCDECAGPGWPCEFVLEVTRAALRSA
jgi:hypothetical protein